MQTERVVTLSQRSWQAANSPGRIGCLGCQDCAGLCAELTQLIAVASQMPEKETPSS